MTRVEYVKQQMIEARKEKERRRREILGINEKPIPALVPREVKKNEEGKGEDSKEEG